MPAFSVLDLCPVPEKGTARDAFRNSLDLAQHAEKWGYRRFWLAEHHNMPGIASAATAVVIGHIAAGTKVIRVGSGGIMLPNHTPLVIAEQFGTLATLFPFRIDLGLGRAAGTDPVTAKALRRNLIETEDQFPQDVMELQNYFRPVQPGQKVRAVPGAGLEVPIWLLGSSLFSAQLAARLGLPFAFASHFAPTHLLAAIHLYRTHFQPSAELSQPYVMAGVNVIAASNDNDGRRHFTSLQQAFVNLRRGRPGRLPPPIDAIEDYCSTVELAMLDDALACSMVGSPETVERGLQNFIRETQVDELMLTANIYDHAARLESFRIAAGILSRETVLA